MTVATVAVVVLGAVALALVVGRVRARLPPAPPFDGPGKRVRPDAEPVAALNVLVRRLSLARSSAYDLHFELRPLVQEVAAARLARAHGIDLVRDPERAHKLLGDGLVWELVRPDRPTPERDRTPGWGREELEELVDGLERV
jgi:hypothetical protein